MIWCGDYLNRRGWKGYECCMSSWSVIHQVRYLTIEINAFTGGTYTLEPYGTKKICQCRDVLTMLVSATNPHFPARYFFKHCTDLMAFTPSPVLLIFLVNLETECGLNSEYSCSSNCPVVLYQPTETSLFHHIMDRRFIGSCLSCPVFILNDQVPVYNRCTILPILVLHSDSLMALHMVCRYISLRSHWTTGTHKTCFGIDKRLAGTCRFRFTNLVSESGYVRKQSVFFLLTFEVFYRNGVDSGEGFWRMQSRKFSEGICWICVCLRFYFVSFCLIHFSSMIAELNSPNLSLGDIENIFLKVRQILL